MFLNTLKNNNPKLIEYSFDAINKGLILPDTYLLDLDTIVDNAKNIKSNADKYGIKLFGMLKQIGRNPIVAKALMDVGFDGVVAVDYKEALLMIEHNIKLGNVGHLVQIPKHSLTTILKAKPEVFTVYSKEMIYSINEICKQLNCVQKLLIRISDDDSNLYSGQVAGFSSIELLDLLKYIDSLDYVEVGGLTVFPALLYDGHIKDVIETANMKAMNRAINICNEYGLKDLMINLPSANCSISMKKIHELGGNCSEPGHGLTGTTPMHKDVDLIEKVAYAYVSEVSHNYKDKAYGYGGGYYRRGHLKNALVGKSINDYKRVDIKAPDVDSIDYYFELSQNCNVNDGIIMCFRTQMFTTRSHIAVVKGLKDNTPEIMGIYDPWGRQIDRNW